MQTAYEQFAAAIPAAQTHRDCKQLRHRIAMAIGKSGFRKDDNGAFVRDTQGNRLPSLLNWNEVTRLQQQLTARREELQTSTQKEEPWTAHSNA